MAVGERVDWDWVRMRGERGIYLFTRPAVSNCDVGGVAQNLMTSWGRGSD